MAVSGSSIPEGHDAESIKLCNKHCDHSQEAIGTPVTSAGMEVQYNPTPYEAPPKPEINTVSDILQGNTRQEGELYCDYRARMYWEGRVKKQYFAGKTVWIGKERGEIHNIDRLTRTNKKRRKIEAREERKRS